MSSFTLFIINELVYFIEAVADILSNIHFAPLLVLLELKQVLKKALVFSAFLFFSISLLYKAWPTDKEAF